MAKLEWEAVKPMVLRMYYTYKGPGTEDQCRRKILTSNNTASVARRKNFRRDRGIFEPGAQTVSRPLSEDATISLMSRKLLLRHISLGNLPLVLRTLH